MEVHATSDAAAGVRPRRTMVALFGGVALARTGFIAAATAAPLVAEDMLGSAMWSGAPAAVTVVGTAAGAAVLSLLMDHRGRRLGLVTGYALAAGAAILAAAFTGSTAFSLLLGAMFLLGAGNSAANLSRYAAADLYPEGRRARAIGVIVWAGTVGAVLGPLLLEPAESWAEAAGLDGFAGPFLLAAVGFALAALVAAAVRRSPTTSLRHGRRALSGEALRSGGVRLALVALIAGQVVMVLIMVMTPVHIRDSGESLGSVGVVIAAHTLGMFALSPLSGWLSDRYGRVRLITAAGLLLGAAGIMSAFAAGDDRVVLVVSLFLLGLGWNFGFVAGSALLTDAAPAEDRVRLQGLADSLIWGSAAVASLSSGLLLEAGGYARLSLVGAALALIPLAAVIRYRAALVPA